MYDKKISSISVILIRVYHNDLIVTFTDRTCDSRVRNPYNVCVVAVRYRRGYTENPFDQRPRRY